MRASLSRPLVRVTICVFVGALFSALQLSPQRHSWWGLMDDAEPLSWRPPGGTMRLSDVPRVIASRTEVGQFGRSVRYRPVYYSVKVLEAWAWGAHPARWYRARAVMFATVLAGSALVLWMFCGPWLAIGGFALLFSGWYWRDIWAHLGYSENYTSIATVLLALGMAIVWRTKAISLGLCLAAVGTALAVGCKENHAVFIVPLAFTAWRARGTHPRAALAAFLVGVASVAVIVIALAFGLRHVTTDMYGTPFTPGVRLWWIGAAPGALVAGLWAAFALAAFASMRVVRKDGEVPGTTNQPGQCAALRDILRDLAILLTVVTALIVTQATYYATHWPTYGGRFDFPGRLVDVLLPLGVVIAVLRWLRLTGLARPAWMLERVAPILFILVAARHGILPVRDAATTNQAYTWALRDTLQVARDSAAVRPGAPVVIEWFQDGELEPVLSLVTLLSELGVRGPYFLRQRPQPTGVSVPSPLLDSLAGGGFQLAGQKVAPTRDLSDALRASSGRAVVLTVRDYEPPSLRYDGTP